MQCTGETPICSPCKQRGTACEYRALPAETFSTAQLRRLNAYDELSEILRRSREDDAALITRRIRSGEGVEPLVRSLQEGDLLLQLSLQPEWRYQYDFPGHFQPMPSHLSGRANPYLQSKSLRGSLGLPTNQRSLPNPDQVTDEEKFYAVPYRAVRLADSRLEHIDLTKYTKVTQDASLLRSLLEVYLLFEYPFNSFFHADFFLDDIISGDDRHSSPVLVNAVLAAAWVRLCL